MNIDLPVQLFTAHPVDCIGGHKATSAKLDRRVTKNGFKRIANAHKICTI